MSEKGNNVKSDKLGARVALICDALERAEPSRLLMAWRNDPDDEALEAMRRAIHRVDGTLNITTDALVAAFDAGLAALTPRGKARLHATGRRRRCLTG